MDLKGQRYNVGYCFARLAVAHPLLPAIVAADIEVSYSKLWRIVRGFAVKMRGLGIDRKSTVAVASRDMIAAVAAMLATSLLGARYVTMDSSLVDSMAVKPTHFLRSPDDSRFAGISFTKMDASWPTAAPPGNQLDEGEFPGFAGPEDPWWILPTSGTTGTPKFLEISQRAVHDRSLAVSGEFRALETRFCSIFPCTTRPFFTRAMAALLNATTIIDTIDPDFIRAQGVNLVCGAPATTVKWLDGRTFAPRLPRLQVSGAKLTEADARVLLNSFAVVEDVYGSSETNKSYVNAYRLEDNRMLVKGCPQDSLVEIVDDRGAGCAPGTKGLVRIRNGYMASAYIGQPEATARAFRDGWFYPGDLASWGPNKELLIAGRNDEVINLGGTKVDPAAMEEVLRSIPGVKVAACFRDPVESNPPRLAAFVCLAAQSDPGTTTRTAYDECLKRFGPAVAPHIIVVVPAIPIGKDGAPNRNECMRMMPDKAARAAMKVNASE